MWIKLVKGVLCKIEPSIRKSPSYVTDIRPKIGAIFLGIFISASLFTLQTPSEALTVGELKNISNNNSNSVSPASAVSATGTILVAWADDGPGQQDIFLANSTDNGLTFEGHINISNDGAFSNLAKIAVSEDKAYAVWSEDDGEIYFVNGTIGNDNTLTFGSPVNLSNNPAGISDSPIIAAKRSNVYVVWQDDIDGSLIPDIFFTYSNDSGQNFSLPVNLSSDEGNSQSPRLAISDQGDVYVAWQDDTPNPGTEQAIFVRASTDNGTNFGDPSVVNNPAGFSYNPSIVTVGTDSLYLVWGDGTSNYDVFFAKGTVNSLDSTIAFDTPVNISNNTGFSTASQLAVSGSGIIYVMWIDDINGSNDVFISNSTDTGVSFSVPLSLTSGAGANSPQLAILPSNQEDLLATWEDGSVGNSDIFMSEILDTGHTIGEPFNLSSNDGLSISASVAAFGSRFYVAWQDSSSGNNEILFRSISLSEENPIIIIESPESGLNTKWGTPIEVSGTTNGQNTDYISIDWGDGSIPTVISVTGDTWDPVLHSYNSSQVGAREVQATLYDSEGNQKATSDPVVINVQKHETSITIDTIPNVVVEGDNLVVNGTLTDLDNSTSIQGATVTFNGTGSLNLGSAITDPDGHYSSEGASPNSSNTLWTVQANFDGDSSFEPSTSSIETFDTASSNATQFAIPVGAPSTVQLTGFNGSITFDAIESEGTIYVSKCDTPNSERYISLGLCFVISVSEDLPSSSFAHVKFSFSDAIIPVGHNADEVDIFHEGVGRFTDITESRDLEHITVTGRTANFSQFVIGIAEHEQAPEGAIRQQVFVGQNELEFNKLQPQTITFDDTEYSIGSRVAITVQDNAADEDDSSIETIQSNVTSSSDALGIKVILTETGANTGAFSGHFRVEETESSDADDILHVRSGDTITSSYFSPAKAPFIVSIDEVAESGLLELNSFIVDQRPEINIYDFDAIGDAYEFHLVDAQLGQNANISVVMSYVNVDLRNDEIISTDLFRLLQFDPSSVPSGKLGWIDITKIDPSSGHLAINTAEKTVTGLTSTTGNFTIGHDFRVGEPGGGGGGLPRPGTGVVLDAVAGLTTISENRHTGGGGGGGGGARSTSAGQLVIGSDVETILSVGTSSITFNFENIEPGSGQLKISAEDFSKFTNIFDSIITDQGGQKGLVNLDDSAYSTAGKIFDIDASAVKFNGMVKVTIPYDEKVVLLSGPESNVRFLHYDSKVGHWEDATIAFDTEKNTITGMMDTLSPVVAAVVNDGTFGNTYFKANPLNRIITSIEQDGIISVRPDNPVSIPLILKNIQRTDQNYTLILQITDKDDVAIYINWQTGSLIGGQSTEVSRSWLAGDAGEYAIKLLLLDSFDHPLIISSPVTLEIKVAD